VDNGECGAFAAGRPCGVVGPVCVHLETVGGLAIHRTRVPDFLLAACAAITSAATVIRRPRQTLSSFRRHDIATVGVVLASALMLAFALARGTPVLMFTEELSAGEDATIFAGDRDGAFFSRNEWPEVVTSGAIVTRVSPNDRASVMLPLIWGTAYQGVVRIDPSPAPATGTDLPAIAIRLNGRLLGICHSGSSPTRIGSCRLDIPADAVRRRGNRLTFAAAGARGFRMSYVRVHRL
jgi:hypothetical protein